MGNRGNRNPKPNILLHPERRPRGRPKGVKNKVQTEAKQHILNVFDYLQRTTETSLRTVAKGKPDWFYDSIWRLIVPREIKGDMTHDISGSLMTLAVQVAQDLKHDKK